MGSAGRAIGDERYGAEYRESYILVVTGNGECRQSYW